jgi:nucleotide-binding universal stress UspA family protein
MIKAILIPTDFSECAGSANQLAHYLALASGARVYYFHMFADYSEPVHVPQSSDHFITKHPREAIHRAQLQELVRRAIRGGIKASSIFVYDHGSDKIQDYIESYDIDLVVMCSHGVVGLHTWLKGAYIHSFTQQIQIPVLIVRDLPDHPIKSILYMSSFNHDCTKDLKRISIMANLTGATVNLLFVMKLDDDKTPHEAQKILVSYRNAFQGAIDSADMVSTENDQWRVSDFIQAQTPDMVAMSRNEYDLFFLSRNVSRDLLKLEHVPFLIL